MTRWNPSETGREPRTVGPGLHHGRRRKALDCGQRVPLDVGRAVYGWLMLLGLRMVHLRLVRRSGLRVDSRVGRRAGREEDVQRALHRELRRRAPCALWVPSFFV